MKTKLFLYIIFALVTFNLAFAQETKKDSITAKQVIDNYVSAVGGNDNLINLKDRTTIMRGSVSGTDVTMVIYQKTPDKIRQEINAGAVEQVIKYDGKKAVMIVGENSRELTGSALESLKYEAQLNFYLKLDELNIKTTLLGTEKVNKNDVYKIELKIPSGEVWKQFFDIKTGLKIKSSKTLNTPQGSFAQTTYFGDYKTVGGVKFPFSVKQTVGPQSLEFKVSSIKVNTGLKDDIFKIE